jgi:hypothetical protein
MSVGLGRSVRLRVGTIVERLMSAERELYDELKTNRLGEGVPWSRSAFGFGWLRNALRAIP